MDTFQVECPCCHGERMLWLYQEDAELGQLGPARVQCCHCEGIGAVAAEVAGMSTPLSLRKQLQSWWQSRL